jgi:hypothetical protein
MNVICDLRASKPREYKPMCDGKRLQKMLPGVGLYEDGICKNSEVRLERRGRDEGDARVFKGKQGGRMRTGCRSIA